MNKRAYGPPGFKRLPEPIDLNTIILRQELEISTSVNGFVLFLGTYFNIALGNALTILHQELK